MTPPDDAQARVAAVLPGAAMLGLLVPPGSRPVPATALADEAWTAELLELRALTARTDDRRVLATLWWYSASLVLVGPALAGLVAGRRLSARLADTTLHLVGDLPYAATSRSATGDVAADLGESLAAVVAVVARAGGVREAPLRAIATDSLANKLLALGRARGDVAAVTSLAAPLARAAGLPAPRWVEAGGQVFTRRASCCLAWRMPHEVVCTSCPRRDPAERQVLLEDTAARMP
ncbi:FhuF 2Fe-2S C-terminal domain-containing protein [Klenkia soli]|uniref:FhuF 2Fe-2S C-terminal domain-containing protein n=1 Tax=Klenkia soli TaxID=1052260 RepID=A0A1H0N553_9ACTN|nr:(2Fe-2S)-binding protein [Klenkia soli]SDO87844.1 FhuF 2Fe-2S C-terminal domain-containing protein [Klenkia soli]